LPTFPNLVLPSCLTWDFSKISKFSTTVQTPQSMRHPASSTLQKSVIYELQLAYEFLKEDGLTYDDDVAYIVEFYEACRGGYGWFTFDPSQYNLAKMSVVADTTKLSNGFFGIGDGATVTFPLWRSTSALGNGTATFCELIQNVTLLDGIFQNNVVIPAAGYTLSNFPAQITFAAPPPLGAVLSWAGSYSYLCKFAEDLLEMKEFLYQLWELQSLKLETINL